MVLGFLCEVRGLRWVDGKQTERSHRSACETQRVIQSLQPYTVPDYTCVTTLPTTFPSILSVCVPGAHSGCTARRRRQRGAGRGARLTLT